jgi:PhnB protein
MNIPTGHQAVMPYLMMEDAAAFIEFLKTVFNAEMTHESMRDGIVGHCEAQINGGTIMFSNSRGEWKPQTANMFVYVDDADDTYAKAVENGSETIMPPADQEYGRSCGVTDPFGNVWWITSAPA